MKGFTSLAKVFYKRKGISLCYRSLPQRVRSLAFVARSSRLRSGNHARSLLEPRFREIPFRSKKFFLIILNRLNSGRFGKNSKPNLSEKISRRPKRAGFPPLAEERGRGERTFFRAGEKGFWFSRASLVCWKLKETLATGFTLIEMLVVISIMALLSSLLILYSRAGENQIILFRDQAKVISALNRAKSLSVQMFNVPQPPCAFGVYFSQAENRFLIFRDLALNCRDVDHVYTGPEELFESYQLSSKIKFGELTLTNIAFIPPDPKTLIDNDPNKNEANITLETLDGNASLKVKVNSAGQITTQ